MGRAIRSSVDEGRPLLGICLGMQWLFEGSEEAPELSGSRPAGRRCYRLPGETNWDLVKIPHVGWNALELRRDDSIVDGVSSAAQVYFTHSFVAPITRRHRRGRPSTAQPFASIVQRGQVAGVQFHPEKSGEVGLQILRNFLSMHEC